LILKLLKKTFKNKDKSTVNIDFSNQNTKLQIATCVILLEAVTADSHFSIEESDKIVDLLTDKFKLSRSEVDQLINISKKQREEQPDIWHFTNLINEELSIDEKFKLMEMVWQAIYSDGTLDKYEHYLSHKLRRLLNIQHSKFIELKKKVLEETNNS
jgi:uncharacterized tellurite resistance protein B-like protein